MKCTFKKNFSRLICLLSLPTFIYAAPVPPDPIDSYKSEITEEYQLDCLLTQYSIGPNKDHPEVQRDGLALAKYYAEQNWESGIEFLVRAYDVGLFGLNNSDPSVQAEGLSLAKHYADKMSDYATYYLLLAYRVGGFGLNPNDPEVQQEGRRLAQEYAEKGSRHAQVLFSGTYRYSLDEVAN